MSFILLGIAGFILFSSARLWVSLSAVLLTVRFQAAWLIYVRFTGPGVPDILFFASFPSFSLALNWSVFIVLCDLNCCSSVRGIWPPAPPRALTVGGVGERSCSSKEIKGSLFLIRDRANGLLPAWWGSVNCFWNSSEGSFVSSRENSSPRSDPTFFELREMPHCWIGRSSFMTS